MGSPEKRSDRKIRKRTEAEVRESERKLRSIDKQIELLKTRPGESRKETIRLVKAKGV